MKFILGTKNGMTQVFRADGTVVPVTRVKAGPCVVTCVKTEPKDGVDAVQVGFFAQKKFRLKKPQQGHLRGLETVKILKEFKSGGQNLKRGDKFTVDTFAPGDKVKVTGWSKGKGFQGVVKRHGFAGSPASHGHKDQLRMPGSIGAGGVQRVFKNLRMAGHMGDAQVSVRNLEVVEINPKENELLIKGALPGAKGGLLVISAGEGEIKVLEDNTDEKKEAQEPAAASAIETAEEKAEKSGL